MSEGGVGGVMFVGEAPGREEEQEGRPFIGPAGMLLRDILARLNFTNFHFTNLVCCRSCEPLMDETNQPRMSKGFRGKPPEVMYVDKAPLPEQLAACRTRLLEQIYIVDPVLIVALGQVAAEALLERKVAITQARGVPEHCDIPGRSFKPMLTEARQQWERKVRGTVIAPVARTSVRYLVLPVYHPSFVLRKINDRGPSSPFQYFVKDIRSSIKIYERYMGEVLGVVPQGDTDVNVDEVGESYASYGEDSP